MENIEELAFFLWLQGYPSSYIIYGVTVRSFLKELDHLESSVGEISTSIGRVEEALLVEGGSSHSH